MAEERETGVLTFLIADVRGYSRYTEEFGDEAAARLATEFMELVEEGVQAHGGELIEVRGDEGLAVFTSARQAIRAAVARSGLASHEYAEPHMYFGGVGAAAVSPSGDLQAAGDARREAATGVSP